MVYLYKACSTGSSMVLFKKQSFLESALLRQTWGRCYKSRAHSNLEKNKECMMTTFVRKQVQKTAKYATLIGNKDYVDHADLMFIKTSGPRKKNADPRRAQVWSSLLWQHCVDILNDDSLGLELPKDKKLAIGKVQVADSLGVLRIYWYGSGTEDDAVIEAKLDAIAHPLRLQLMRLNEVGSVPHIRFVKDMSRNNWLEINRLLAVADYGPDYKPSVYGKLSELAADDQEPNQLSRSVQHTEDPIVKRKLIDLPAACRAAIVRSDRRSAVQKSFREEPAKHEVVYSCTSSDAEKREIFLDGSDTVEERFSTSEQQQPLFSTDYEVRPTAIRCSTTAGAKPAFEYQNPLIGKMGGINYSRTREIIAASQVCKEARLPYGTENVDLVNLVRPKPRDKQLRMKLDTVIRQKNARVLQSHVDAAFYRDQMER